jgi:hypothetical protein
LLAHTERVVGGFQVEDDRKKAFVKLAVERLTVAIRRLVRKGRAACFEPDPPGLSPEEEVVRGVAAIASCFAEVLEQLEAKLNRLELEKLELALELAGEAVKHAELAVEHTRKAELAAMVQWDPAERMINDTLSTWLDLLAPRPAGPHGLPAGC